MKASTYNIRPNNSMSLSSERGTHDYSKRFEAILDWLSGLNFDAHQAYLTQLRVPRTGQWFLDSATVRLWVENGNGQPKKPALLCQGIPGAGKTVLAALLVKHLADSIQDGQDHGLAYTHCSERNSHSSHSLLSSFVKQLSRGRQEQQVMARLRALHDDHQPWGSVPSSLEVSGILEYVATLYPHVYLVADGLDEMPMDERGPFLRALGLLCQRQKHVRFLAMTRWGIEYEFKEHFDNYVTQTIRATEEDIRSYVQHELSNHHRFPRQWLGEQDAITAKIVASAGEMFLFAVLSMPHLVEAPTLAQAIDIISRRPPEIDAVWDQAASWVATQPKHVTKYKFMLLSWLVYEKRPLTTIELQHAIAIQEGGGDPKEIDLSNMDNLLSEFRGIVKTEGTGLPRVAHKSASKYFTEKGSKYLPGAEQQVLRASSSDGFLLSFLRDCHKRSASVQALMASGGQPGYSQDVPKLWTATHMMAYFGLHDALKKYALEGEYKEVNATDSYGRTPLSWAAAKGRLDVAKQLISLHIADSGLLDREGRAPMWYATRYDRKAVLELLLEDMSSSEDRPLGEQVFKSVLVAAENGHEKSLEVLLKTKHVEPNMKNNRGRTPLWIAADNGHVEASIVALRLGAKLGEPDNDGHRPLSRAVARGHLAVVKLFLDYEEVTVTEEDERSLILLAAENGHDKVVALLIQKSGDAGKKADIWRWAVDTRSWSVLELLVDREDFVDQDINDGRTILTLASQMGQDSVVKRILGLHPQKMNKKDRSGRLPLSLAVEFGQTAVVKVLVKTFKADPNEKDASSEVPILLAVRHNKPDILSLLLDNGADSPVSAGGRTLLSLVAENGSREITQNLVKRTGVDLNAGDDTKRTPLSWAAGHGNDEFIRCLLEQDGILVNAADVNSRTPLFWAVTNGCAAAAALLIDKVENINHADKDGRTVLHEAVMNGKESLASMLLSKSSTRADMRDKDDKTPLLMALEGADTRQELIRKLAQKDMVTLHIMAEHNRHELVAPLANAGYDLNKLRFPTGRPIQEAIRKGNTVFLEALIDAGADTKEPDFDELTPLRLAIRQRKKELVETLLKCQGTMTGVLAEELRDIFKLPESPAQQSTSSGTSSTELNDSVILSITESAEKGYEVETTKLSAVGSTWWPAKSNARMGRRLCHLDHDPGWLKTNHSGSDGLEWGTKASSVDTDEVFFAEAWFTARPNIDQQTLPTWKCRIGWTVSFTEGASKLMWTTRDHFSMMPYGWFPEDGIDFFQLFIQHMEKTWHDLCDTAQNDLLELRRTILIQRGEDKELINRLLDHANLWANTRHTPQRQVIKSRDFNEGYCKRLLEQPDPRLKAPIEGLERSVSIRIDSLDRILQDLIQIEFNLVSIREAQLSTSTSTSMKRLSWITFFFLPLAFIAGLFGMNINLLESNPPWWFYIIFASVTMIITFAVWIVFKRYPKLEKQIEEQFEWLVDPENWQKSRARDVEAKARTTRD
ncbi:hypothetical protein NCS52_00446500 [Fusarium sp. LHS14.1]|nr:hypothetical protein NCS52_00446500 [Fusarium sp. LHS14.1]